MARDVLDSPLNPRWQLGFDVRCANTGAILPVPDILPTGLTSTRWTPGLRVSYRIGQQIAVESELSLEQSKVSGPSRNESSSRVFYFLGGRYDF